jgi:hypothetical protein
MNQLEVLSRPGAYSLVQLCPDPQRMETATVGVVLFSPEWRVCEIGVSSDFKRARRFFGPNCPPDAQLHFSLRNLVSRLKSEEPYLESFDDFETLCVKLSGIFLLTQPRYTKVSNPASDLEELFGQVVTVPENRRLRLRRIKGPAIPDLDILFRQAKFDGRVRYRKEVVVPLTEKKLTVPYAYLNGCLNLVQPVLFRGPERGIAEQAKKLGTDGLFLKKTHGEPYNYQLVVVARFSEQRLQDAASDKVRNVLGELATDYYTVDQLGDLEMKVEREARPLPDEIGSTTKAEADSFL